MEKKILIIPDVHGRKFWEVVKEYNDVPIVFLGDYLDPYTSIEGITHAQALSNFKDVLNFAEENKDRVTLLYGNHDSYAFKNRNMCSCRHDWENIKEIEKLFDDNSDLFKISYDVTVNDKHFLFTHAGLNPFWVDKYKSVLGVGFNYTAEELNSIKKEDLNKILCDISTYRGGFDMAGSLVWTDIHEHVFDIKNLNLNIDFNVPDNLVQVFGHTWLQTPIHFDCGQYEIYCLDVNKVFYLDDEGNIRYLENNELVSTIT